MARPRIQCNCGAKMKPAATETLAPGLQEGIERLQRALPTATVQAHICPKCKKAHLHAKV